jgi:hypothetical protein
LPGNFTINPLTVAPETLAARRSTRASDVWMLGGSFWALHNVGNSFAVAAVPTKPGDASKLFYQCKALEWNGTESPEFKALILSCYSPESHVRPEIDTLVARLDKLCNKELELEKKSPLQAAGKDFCLNRVNNLFLFLRSSKFFSSTRVVSLRSATLSAKGKSNLVLCIKQDKAGSIYLTKQYLLLRGSKAFSIPTKFSSRPPLFTVKGRALTNPSYQSVAVSKFFRRLSSYQFEQCQKIFVQFGSYQFGMSRKSFVKVLEFFRFSRNFAIISRISPKIPQKF